MTLVLLLVYCNYFNVLCGVSAERFCKVTDIVSFPQIFQELFFCSRAALPLQRGCFPKASAKVVAFSEPTKYFNIFLSQNFHMKSQPAVSAAVMAQSFFKANATESCDMLYGDDEAVAQSIAIASARFRYSQAQDYFRHTQNRALYI